MTRLPPFLLLGLACLVAGAAAPAPPVKHDANAPINVAADRFIADNNAKTGTWSGNVVVTQADMRMRANSVRLNVTGKENKPDKVFATGQVVVDSPNSGTVTGDAGVYDVVARTVTMTGKVVLTRGKDVMRGSPLVVNLDTGQAVLGGRPAATVTGQPAAASGRVQGVFTPSGAPSGTPAN